MSPGRSKRIRIPGTEIRPYIRRLRAVYCENTAAYTCRIIVPKMGAVFLRPVCGPYRSLWVLLLFLSVHMKKSMESWLLRRSKTSVLVWPLESVESESESFTPDGPYWSWRYTIRGVYFFYILLSTKSICIILRKKMSWCLLDNLQYEFEHEFEDLLN